MFGEGWRWLQEGRSAQQQGEGRTKSDGAARRENGSKTLFDRPSVDLFRCEELEPSARRVAVYAGERPVRRRGRGRQLAEHGRGADAGVGDHLLRKEGAHEARRTSPSLTAPDEPLSSARRATRPPRRERGRETRALRAGPRRGGPRVRGTRGPALARRALPGGAPRA